MAEVVPNPGILCMVSNWTSKQIGLVRRVPRWITVTTSDCDIKRLTRQTTVTNSGWQILDCNQMLWKMIEKFKCSNDTFYHMLNFGIILNIFKSFYFESNLAKHFCSFLLLHVACNVSIRAPAPYLCPDP